MDEGDNHAGYGGAANTTATGTASSMPVVTTVFGRSRTFGRLQVKEWAFLIVSVLNLLATVGLTVYRLVYVVEHDPKSPDFTFTILILVNAGFCAVYVIHGLLRELQYEIYAVIAGVTIILLYVVIEYSVNAEGRNAVKLARLVCACVLAPVQIILSVLVAQEFGWLEFRIVGASEALQIMYREASRFTSLLKFDLQVAVSFVILVLTHGTEVDTLDLITLAVGIPISLLLALGGWQLLRYELRWAAWLFGLFCLLEPAYVIYKLVKIYEDFDKNIHENMTLVYTSLAAGMLALLVRAVLYIELYRVYRNFGHGLRERAFGVGPDEHTSLLSAGPVRRR